VSAHVRVQSRRSQPGEDRCVAKSRSGGGLPPDGRARCVAARPAINALDGTYFPIQTRPGA